MRELRRALAQRAGRAPRRAAPARARARPIFSARPWDARRDGDPRIPTSVLGRRRSSSSCAPAATSRARWSSLDDGRYAVTGPTLAVGGAAAGPGVRRRRLDARRRRRRAGLVAGGHRRARTLIPSRLLPSAQGLTVAAEGRGGHAFWLWVCAQRTRRLGGRRMADGTLDRDEQRLAELGYKQELDRGWSRFSNFAISFTIISVLAGCFTTFAQAWNNGGPIAISWAGRSSALIILTVAVQHGRAGLGLSRPPAGRTGGPTSSAARAGSWFTGWFNIVGLIGIVASVGLGRCALPHATFDLWGSTSASSTSPTRLTSLGEIFMLSSRDPRALHAMINIFSSHLGRAVQQHLGVAGTASASLVDHRDPDRRPRPSPERRLRLHRADQQLRASRAWACSGGHILPIGFLLDDVHGHRLRRVGAHGRGDAGRRDRGGQGRLAVGRSLGADRLVRAARDHVRGERRRRPSTTAAARSLAIFQSAMTRAGPRS